MEPIIVDAADAGLIHRKRLWWKTISWEAVEERISDCTPWSFQWHIDRGWPRLHNPMARDLQQPLTAKGYFLPSCLHREGKLFHCLTTPAPQWMGDPCLRPSTGITSHRRPCTGGMQISEGTRHGNTRTSFSYNGLMGPIRRHQRIYANSSKDYDLVSQQISPMGRRSPEKWHWATPGTCQRRCGFCFSYSWDPCKP